MMNRSPVLTCYDLCCGAGALSEGFRRAGARVLGGIDICPQSLATAKKNHAEGRWDCIGIEEFAAVLDGQEAHPVWHANVLLAGLPCQGFSRAGNRDPSDPRNSLFLHLVEVADRVRPDYVVCENVVGFAEPRNSRAFQALQRGLRRLGYDVATRVLDAADYGVPQYRKRVFLVAVREGQANRVFESLRPKWQTPPVRTAFRGLSSTRENKAASHVFMKHGRRVRAKLHKLKPGGPISYRRLLWHRPAATLVAGHRALPVHPSQPRAISVREAARLQGFHDSYTFEGSNSSQILQVANAVPPPLAGAIARALLRSRAHAERVRGALYEKLVRQREPALRRRLTRLFGQIHRARSRQFPWRKVQNPFRVLLTEILLQRTNAELAETVWRDIMKLAGTPKAAASADLRSLGALTRRIGIRSRARTIKELGAVLLRRHHGRVPWAFDDLLRLPGVGLYIASAVRSLCFGERDFPVDCNAFRFVSRYFGVRLRGKKSEGRQLREFVSSLMPPHNPREYVYGFLDFAATICRPLNPRCETCCLQRSCKRHGVAAKGGGLHGTVACEHGRSASS